MKLILMRHAEAGEFDPLRYPDDSLRPLSKDGVKIQHKVAKALKRIGLKPARIFTSPRLRARQTAEITAETLGLQMVLMESPALGKEYSVKTVLKLLAGCGAEETVLCVGHEPDLSELCGALLSPGHSLSIKFVKSGVMGVKFDGPPKPGTATLIYFYRPQDLLVLA